MIAWYPICCDVVRLGPIEAAIKHHYATVDGMIKALLGAVTENKVVSEMSDYRQAMAVLLEYATERQEGMEVLKQYKSPGRPRVKRESLSMEEAILQMEQAWYNERKRDES